MLPYTYVPKRTPHPLSDPAGHRFAGRGELVDQLDLDDWRRCTAHCYAVRLFNAGYYWEAHEVWEGCWVAVGRSGWLAGFLKALIKLSAACVKAREGNAAGVERHARRAEQLANEATGGRSSDLVAGVSVSQVVRIAQGLQQRASELAAAHQSDDPYAPAPIVRLDLEP